MADAATSVTGHTGGLVQHQQAGVFEHDGCLHAGQEAIGWWRLVFRVVETDWRNAHFVARLQLALGLGPPPVDPYLATAYQLVDQTAGGTLQLAQQEVVQALSFTVSRHLHVTHGGLGRPFGSACGGLFGHQGLSVTLGGRYKGLISQEVVQFLYEVAGQKPGFPRFRQSARPPPLGRPC